MASRWIRFGEWSVLGLLAFAVLWKGGKGLEATWLFALLAFALGFLTWRMRFTDRQACAERVPGLLWTGVLLFVLWTAVSWFGSQTRNYGLDEVLRTAAAAFLFLWIIRMRALGRLTVLPDHVPRGMSVLAMGAGLIGIAVYALQPVNRFTGTFFDARFHTDYWPNAWAQFLLLAWPLLLWTLWTDRERPRLRVLWPVGLALLLSALFLSYSRGALIAFAGQIVLLGAFLLWQWFRHRADSAPAPRSLQKAGMTVVAVLALAGLLCTSVNALRSVRFDVQSVAEKATFTAAEGRSSVSERSQFWSQARALGQARPLLGWGPYSFRFVQTPLMTDVLATSDHPHNIFLKIAMERGVPALLLLLFLCGFIAVAGVRRVLQGGDARAALLLVALAGFLAHNLIDYNVQFVGILLPAVLLAALLVDRDASLPATPLPRAIRLRVPLIEQTMLLALTALLLWEGGHLALSSAGRHAEARGDAAAALHWYARSRRSLFPRDLELSRARLLTDRRSYGQAAAALEAYARTNAEDARLWKLRGEWELRRGRYAEAAAAFGEAFRRGAFTDASITRLYIEALRRNGQGDRLEELRYVFTEVFRQFGDAILHNAHFIALSQNPEELLALSGLLEDSYPESSVDFHAIARSAFDHALEERSRYAARPPGILW